MKHYLLSFILLWMSIPMIDGGLLFGIPVWAVISLAVALLYAISLWVVIDKKWDELS